MKRLMVVLVALCIASTSAASYVRTCIWEGVVTSVPAVLPLGEVSFEMKIDRAERDQTSRCDGGCSQDRGEIRKIDCWTKTGTPAPKRGQRVWVRSLFKDNEGSSAGYKSYDLLTEQEARDAMKTK